MPSVPAKTATGVSNAASIDNDGKISGSPRKESGTERPARRKGRDRSPALQLAQLRVRLVGLALQKTQGRRGYVDWLRLISGSSPGLGVIKRGN